MLINLTKITFETLLRKKNFCPTPKFWMMSFYPTKWPNFDHFHQKWPSLTKSTQLMIVLTNVMILNLTEILFETVYKLLQLICFLVFASSVCWPFLCLIHLFRVNSCFTSLIGRDRCITVVNGEVVACSPPLLNREWRLSSAEVSPFEMGLYKWI